MMRLMLLVTLIAVGALNAHAIAATATPAHVVVGWGDHSPHAYNAIHAAHEAAEKARDADRRADFYHAPPRR
jgi:hypothetical protein